MDSINNKADENSNVLFIHNKLDNSKMLGNYNHGSNKDIKPEGVVIGPELVAKCNVVKSLILNKTVEKQDGVVETLKNERNEPNTAADLGTDLMSTGSFYKVSLENKVEEPNIIKNLEEHLVSNFSGSKTKPNPTYSRGKIELPPHANYKIKCKMKYRLRYLM